MRCERDRSRPPVGPSSTTTHTTKTGSTKNGSGGTSPAGTGGTGTVTGTGGTGATGTTGGTGTTIDPSTGLVEGSSAANTADAPLTVPTGLAGYRSTNTTKLLAPIAVVLLLLALAGPPLLARRISRRRSRS
jgi:hypothetical protein